MFVAKYKNWGASVVLRDGGHRYFDGPKDLFTYYFDPGKYERSRKQGDIVGIKVTDYYTLAVIDAGRAFFVVGSKVLGPMGAELVPFAKKTDAEGFQRDHGGKPPLTFREVTPALLKTLH